MDDILKIKDLNPIGTNLKESAELPITQEGATYRTSVAEIMQKVADKNTGKYLLKDEKVPNENLNFGKVEKGDTNVVSGREVYDSIKDFSSGVIPINLSTETPTKNGVFEPLEVGIYTNFGGLELTQQEKDSSIVYFYLLNGVFSKQVKSVSTTDVVGPNNTNAISSRGVYNFSIRNVSNIAELRTIVGEEGQKVNLLGYYEAGDKPELLYKWVEGVGEDDGGSVIESIGGYWSACFVDSVDIRHFGASSKLQNSDRQIQNAIIYTEDNNRIKVFVPEGRFVIHNTINIRYGNILIEGEVTLRREEAWNENRNKKPNKYGSFFAVKKGVTAFHVLETCVDPISFLNVGFHPEIQIYKDGNSIAIKYSAKFDGPLWNFNINYCHFTGFNTVLFIETRTLQYNIAFMDLSNNAFGFNEDVVKFGYVDRDVIGKYMPLGQRSAVAQFNFNMNRCHDNSRVISGSVIYSEINISRNNLEGHKKYLDGSYPEAYIELELHSGVVNFEGNYGEHSHIPYLKCTSVARYDDGEVTKIEDNPNRYGINNIVRLKNNQFHDAFNFKPKYILLEGVNVFMYDYKYTLYINDCIISHCEDLNVLVNNDIDRGYVLTKGLSNVDYESKLNYDKHLFSESHSSVSYVTDYGEVDFIRLKGTNKIRTKGIDIPRDSQVHQYICQFIINSRDVNDSVKISKISDGVVKELPFIKNIINGVTILSVYSIEKGLTTQNYTIYFEFEITSKNEIHISREHRIGLTTTKNVYSFFGVNNPPMPSVNSVNFSPDYSQNKDFGEASLVKKGNEVFYKIFANKSTNVEVGDTIFTLQPELRPKTPEFIVGHGGNGAIVVWLMIEPTTGAVKVQEFPAGASNAVMNAIVMSGSFFIRE